MKRSQIKRGGQRTAKRRAINVRLKKLWESLGICSCELQLPGCMRTWAMSAAHSKKSRFLLTDDDWMTAVLSCANCHPIIESWTHEAMEKIVLDTIARRGTIE